MGPPVRGGAQAGRARRFRRGGQRAHGAAVVPGDAGPAAADRRVSERCPRAKSRSGSVLILHSERKVNHSVAL